MPGLPLRLWRYGEDDAMGLAVLLIRGLFGAAVSGFLKG
jgi:hypothetical protein